MGIIRTAVIALRSTTASQRAARTEQRRLERELANYRGSERHGLCAILSRHTAEEIEPIERILERQSRLGIRAYQC